MEFVTGRGGRELRKDGLNVLCLYDKATHYVSTCYDHVACVGRYSRHNIFYADAAGRETVRFPLDLFDAILIHYTLRLPFDHLSAEFATAVTRFQGPKLLFIQDEYDHTWKSSAAINDLGIDLVFTCVPDRYVRQVYSRVRPEVEFVQVLTGYLPLELERDNTTLPPIESRPIHIGYRGRELPFRYGKLAREKLIIGQEMKRICAERQVPHDIEWAEDKRIYGDDWKYFLMSCRTTLGAESGCNIFDYDGSLQKRVDELIRREPDITFDEVYERCLTGLENEPIMNQISPRIFEAVATRTALVLFEGEYSGVVHPHEHYIPLRKDFSNADEVLAKVADTKYLEEIVERAHERVIRSGQFTYRRLVQDVDAALERRVLKPKRQEFVGKLVLYKDEHGYAKSLDAANILMQPEVHRLSDPLRVGPANPANLLGLCQGRLTTQKGYPVHVANAEKATALFFTPYNGNRIALLEMVGWQVYTFNNVFIILDSVAANANYDVFIYSKDDKLHLELAAWKDDATRAVELEWYDGIPVKRGWVARRYLGTIRGSAGQMTEDSAQKRFVWNYYHRIDKPLFASDMSCHTYTGPGRAWNNDGALGLEFVSGQPTNVQLQLNALIRSREAGAAALVYPTLDGVISPHVQLGRYAGNYNNQFVGVATGGACMVEPGHHKIGAGEETSPGGGVFASVWLHGTLSC